MQIPSSMAQKNISVVWPVVKDITRKNAADRPLRPTANPSELSIKLNAFVRLITENIVKIPEKIPKETIPKFEISPISTIESPEKITKREAVI